MALTTSAVHSDVALGAAGGVVTRGAALRSASPCWLVSAAVFL